MSQPKRPRGMPILDQRPPWRIVAAILAYLLAGFVVAYVAGR